MSNTPGATRHLLALAACVALAWVTGCASSGGAGRHSSLREEASAAQLDDGGGFGFVEYRDDLQLLQRAAGLEEGSWLGVGEELGRDKAHELWEFLARSPVRLQSFGPRRTLICLLRWVLSRDEAVPYGELLERLRRFRVLGMMRPDGYLVAALTGSPLQRMGRVELRGGRLMAGAFEVGAFYRDKGGVFYPVDELLRPSGGLVGELGLEHDWFNAALDGSEDALGEMVVALAQLVTSPVRSVEGLRQLPSGVAALIASSPEYFARYSALSLREQIREAARLSTHLLLLYGSAAGAATRVAATGATLPVLSLSAEGMLAVEQVAVPVGATTAALGTGAGAVYVLMGPGKGAEEAGRGFKPFTEGNFRENLARLTGRMPEGAHAHHVFPKKLVDKFEKAGINVHDPRFGAWWEQSGHLKNAARYLERWQDFFRESRTAEEILQFGREMGKEFGFQVNF